MTKKILQRLRGYTSRYSFLRVLNQIGFYETTSVSCMTGHELEPNERRLINTEFAFLVGLWLDNYYDESEMWAPSMDNVVMSRIYYLMNEYHKSIDLKDYGSRHMEVSMYEGDGAYQWQYVDLVQYKYESSIDQLQNIGYYPLVVQSLFNKVFDLFQSRVISVLESDEKGLPTTKNLFVFTQNELRAILTDEEWSTLSCFVIKLGENVSQKLNSIAAFYPYLEKPIIALNDGRYFIPNFYIFAKALNESPFYWIGSFTNANVLLSKIGYANENIIYQLLSRLEKVFIAKDIVLSKGNKDVTDIDVFLAFETDVFIFQVKSKKLTLKSQGGDRESIKSDFEKAVLDPYKQGIQCIEELPNCKTTKDLLYSPECKFHLICVTGDYYPTLNATACEYQLTTTLQYPIIAMSVYDIECITYLFDSTKTREYLLFREKCTTLKVYADNESLYIGKFIMLEIDPEEPAVERGEHLPRDYGILMDYFIQCTRARHIQTNAFSHFQELIEDDKSPLLNNVAIVSHSIRSKNRVFYNI